LKDQVGAFKWAQSLVFFIQKRGTLEEESSTLDVNVDLISNNMKLHPAHNNSRSSLKIKILQFQNTINKNM
jgi:hypothetical protein